MGDINNEENNLKRSARSIKNQRKRKSTITVISIIAAFIIIISVFIAHSYKYVKNWDNLIYPGVTVQNLDLSGRTKAQAREILNKAFADRIQNKKINISVEKRNYTINYSDIKSSFNVDETVNLAYSYGKDSNFLKKYKLLKDPKMVNYNLKFYYDKQPIERMIKKIASEVDKDPVNASINMGGIGFNIIPEQNGIKVDQKDLHEQLLSKIDGDVSGDLNVKAKLKSIPAKIKSSDLQKVDTLISSFNTNYGSISSSERANNIALATSTINGTVIMPGDEFSFNNVVGERTAAKGYEAAPVIIGDKLEDGLGGGICQVSTTLYNAVNAAKLTTTERVHHSLPVHYVDEGMDATVDYGNIDYKFRNNFKYPVYIQGYTSGGNVVFNLYSNSAVQK